MKEPISHTHRALGLRAYLNLALAVTIVIFVLASAFTYAQVESRIRADVEVRLDSLSAHLARDTIAAWLEQKRGLARALAAYPAMREMQVDDAQRIITATYAAAPTDYNNIGLFDATGLMVADIAGATGKGNLIKGNPWGQEVYAGQRTQSPELMSSVNNRPIFVLYERVMDASGAVVGAVGVGTNLTAIGERLEGLGIGQTGEAVLVNSQGLVLNRLRDRPDSVLTLDLSKDRLTQLALSGQAGIVEMSDYRGVPVVAAYRFIPEYGWGIVVKQDADEAFAVLARLRVVFFGTIFGALVIVLASNLFVQRRVSLALRRLIEGSQRFAAGQLATRIEPVAIGEFSRLTAALNEMARTLQLSLGQAAYGQRMLVALSQAAQAVQRARTAQEIYQVVGEQIRKLGYHCAIFTLAKDDKNDLIISYMTFESDLLQGVEKLLGVKTAGYRFALEPRGELDRVITGGEVVLSRQVTVVIAGALPTLARPLAGQAASALGIEQGIFAPMRIGAKNEPVGILAVIGRTMLETDMPAVATFANQTAIALENARLYEEDEDRARELQRRVGELTARNRMAGILLESVEARQICSRALEEVLVLVNVDAGAVMELEPASGDMVMIAHRGLTDEFVQAAGRMKKGEGLTWQAAETGKPAVMPDMSKYPGALKGYIQKEHMKSAAVVPLIGRTGVVGTMNVVTSQPRAFDAAGLELLTAVGRQVAIGLEKAHLHAALQDELAERKRAEQALQVYAAKLEQSNRDLQEFAYVASHDLQEPLRKVQAFSDRLADKYKDKLEETGLDYLKRMRDASQRMQTLINDLLNFSRVSARAEPFTPVDLNAVAREVRSDLENRIERTQARVEIEELPLIEADPIQMQQLLQNLIGNALKFQREGIPPLIKVSAQVNNQQCEISVEDNGIGFDTQYLDRIFKPFQRLHNREDYEGSGMGLAICRRIVERHGGSITATSTPGRGTTFLVTLPIHQPKGDK